MTTREERIAQTFVELADTVVAEFDVIDFLHTLTDRIVELLDVDAVGIMLADERGRPHPMASSSEQARLIELYTAQNGEGPCLDCFRTGRPISREDLPAMRAAWPAFTARLEELGFQSAQAIAMCLRDQTIGALNLFRTRPGLLSSADSRLGQAFADVATIGLESGTGHDRERPPGHTAPDSSGQPDPARTGHGHARRTHRPAHGRSLPADAHSCPRARRTTPLASSTELLSIHEGSAGLATHPDRRRRCGRCFAAPAESSMRRCRRPHPASNLSMLRTTRCSCFAFPG